MSSECKKRILQFSKTSSIKIAESLLAPLFQSHRDRFSGEFMAKLIEKSVSSVPLIHFPAAVVSKQALINNKLATICNKRGFGNLERLQRIRPQKTHQDVQSDAAFRRSLRNIYSRLMGQMKTSRWVPTVGERETTDQTLINVDKWKTMVNLLPMWISAVFKGGWGKTE